MYGKKYMGVARTTYLIGPDGKVVKRWDGVKVDGHAEEVLAAVKTSSSEPSAPSVPALARLHVAGMDCADEAALIRHALARPGIDSLNFDLVGRRVDVTFNPERISAAAILDAVAGDRPRRPHAPGRRCSSATIITRTHHHDAAKAWAVASGVLFAIGWIVDGFYADSWSEAIFGRHGEHADHAHHPYAAARLRHRHRSPVSGR